MTETTQATCVWMTDKWDGPTGRLTFRVTLPDYPETLVTDHRALEPPYFASFERIVGVREAMNKGLPHHPEDVPKSMAPFGRGHIGTTLPEVINTTDFMVVTERYAEIFRSADLGHGALYPIDLYQFDRKRRIDQGPFFIVVLGALKNTFVPTELATVNSLRTYDSINNCYDYSPLSLLDDVFCFAPTALEGPDLWIERRIMGNKVFFSDRLKRRFDEADLTAFNFARCPTFVCTQLGVRPWIEFE